MSPVPYGGIVLHTKYEEGHAGGQGIPGFDVGDPIKPTAMKKMIVIIINVLFEFYENFGSLSLTAVLATEAMPRMWQNLILSLVGGRNGTHLFIPAHRNTPPPLDIIPLYIIVAVLVFGI